MEGEGLAPATIGRRFGTVAGFYKYAVLDGNATVNPTLAVTRPRVGWEGQRRTVLHPLEYAALLTAARHDGPSSHALVAVLGMLGLRVSEACNADITDLHYDSGYKLLTIMARAASPRRSRCRCRSCARSTRRQLIARQGLSCSTEAAPE